MQKTVTMLFPTPVAEIKNLDSNFVDTFAKEVLALMSSANDRHLIDTLGNWCTDDNLHTLDSFSGLVSYIDQEVNVFLEEIWRADPNDFKMTGMWSNVHRSYSKHHIHSHPNSFLSGVIYLDVASGDNEDPGNLFFVDPRANSRMQQPTFREKSEITYTSWQYRPENGKMILFPSWLEHGTDPGSYSNDRLRISLSFNYTLIKSSMLTAKLNFTQS